MRFHYPLFLNFIWLWLGVIVFYLWAFKKKRALLNSFAQENILAKLTPGVNFPFQRLKAVLITAGLFFVMISLAGPQWGARLMEVKRRGVDIILAVDCSLSMQAEDMKPTRLEKAKQELASFIDEARGDRIGIIAFAGSAFLQCPLTLDYSANKMFLKIIEPGLIPYPGTALGEAIRLAIKSFSSKERKYKVLILLTDGEDHRSQPLEAAEAAAKEGIRIYTIGIGSPTGELIPLRDESGKALGYKKNKSGELVTSKVDEATLQKIALATSGKYYRATSGEVEVEKIYQDISGMEKKELQSRIYSQYEERYQYFLFFGLILLLFELFIPETKRIG
ncbi:MAG: VWA domain-containing protein [Elusimicrobiota bacterium]